MEVQQKTAPFEFFVEYWVQRIAWKQNACGIDCVVWEAVRVTWPGDCVKLKLDWTLLPSTSAEEALREKRCAHHETSFFEIQEKRKLLDGSVTVRTAGAGVRSTVPCDVSRRALELV